MNRKYDRVVKFDERSKKFPIRKILSATERKSNHWKCEITLDQGSEGACAGFGFSHEAAAEPVVISGITNQAAFDLYYRARQLDEFTGENYEGTSILGAVKAAVEKGWYSEYRWAFGEDDLALAIGYQGPVVLGISWYSGMENPDPSGLIRATGNNLGGHCILCNGYDVNTNLYRLHNSWGPKWGINGECFISVADMIKLLKEDGEACIPLVRKSSNVSLVDFTENECRLLANFIYDTLQCVYNFSPKRNLDQDITNNNVIQFYDEVLSLVEIYKKLQAAGFEGK